jgi:hypothetical protein
MDIETMHAKVLLKIDKMGSYSTSNVISGEIDSFLNESINDYINQQKVALRRPSGDRQSVEAMENLRPLEEDESITTNITSYSPAANGFSFDLDAELSQTYGYYIDGRAQFDDGGNTYWKNCMLVNRTFINKHGITKYNTPVFWEIPVMVDADELVGLYSIDDPGTPVEFYINYLRQADEIHLNGNTGVTSGPYTDLPAHTHETIVKMATNKIIQSLSGQSPQATQQEQEGEE